MKERLSILNEFKFFERWVHQQFLIETRLSVYTVGLFRHLYVN